MKNYSSYKYSSGYEKYQNGFDKYANMFNFENPYARKSQSLSSDAINMIAQGRVDTANKWKEQTVAPVDRSLFDRSIDSLMTVNYMSAGFADGAVKNMQGKSNFFQPWKQMGQGFMAGIGGVLGDGDEKHEYTYSRVMETAGWKPESTFGKVMKGTIGFVGDVLLDPTTYMTLGVSAMLKGTGRVGKAAIALDDVVKKVPELEIYNRTQSLISKGVSPERAATGARKLVEKNVSKYQNVTEMTSEMAEHMIRFDAGKAGTKMSAQELARDATNFAKQFNKSIGIRNYNRDVSIGVRNLPFVGDKLANKMGAAGKTVKIADGDTIRAWSDKLGVAKKYSDVRFAVYGGKIGKMLSTNSPKVKWALKDPVQMYKIVSATEKLMGKDLDKIARKQEITDMARAMNLEPFEQREIIKFMENKANMHKVRTILRIGDTEAAKVYQSMQGDMRPDEFKFYDELEQQYKSIKTLEDDMKAYKAGNGKYAPENVKQAQQEVENVRTGHAVLNDELATLEVHYKVKYDQYVAQLARVDMKKVTDIGEREFLVKAFDEEIARLTSSNKEIAQQLRKVRDDTGGMGKRSDADIMQNVKKVEQEYRQKDIAIVNQIRELSKVKYKEDTVVQDKLKALKVEREEVARNLRIVNEGTPEPYPFDFNAHTPNLQHINAISAKMKAFETIKPQPMKMDGSFDDLSTQKAYEITDNLSNYIFGRSGMIETIKDPKVMQDVLGLIEKGHSPSYIQNIPMIHNDRFLTPRATAMYKLIGAKLGYKNYSKEHLSKLKSLEQKAYMQLPKNMSAGALTDVEKGRFDYLTAQRKQSLMTEEMNTEFKKLVKKMQLQRDYEGMNPGNFNFARLEPEEMQDYLRLKKLDEERDALIRTYTGMSDGEFQTFARFEKTAAQHDDLMEMAHGADGNWGMMDGAGDIEKGFINSDMFYDDIMREMRLMAKMMMPKEQDEFFKKVMNSFTEHKPVIPARTAKLEDEAADMSTHIRAQGKHVKLAGQPDPVVPKKKPRTQPNIMFTAQKILNSKFGGRAYDDLSHAEQKVFAQATIELTLDAKRYTLFMDAVSKRAKKKKDTNNMITRHETIRENVWEGHVVTIGKDKGIVMARRDVELGTEYDVLMANGKTFTVSPDEITSIANGKRYDPKGVADSKFVRESLGNKKELIARINAIDKQVDELAGKLADTALPNVQAMKIKELEEVRLGLMGKMSDELEVYAKERVPTKKAIKAQKTVQTLEGTRKGNRKELVKLRAERAKEADGIAEYTAKLNTDSAEAIESITRRFEVNTKNPVDEHRTRLNAMKGDLQKKLDDYTRNVEEYTLNMNKYTDAINDLGGKTTIKEFEDMSARLAAQQDELKNIDVLEDFMRMQVEKKGMNFDRWARDVMDEESGFNAIMKTIDDSSLNDKQKAWAGLVREFFFRSGLDEVKIGKLKPEQFEAMASTYVYHHASPEFLEYKSMMEKAMGHSSPTQDYGYGIKHSPSSKSRTQDLDIADFNNTMRSELKGKNAFSEDLAEIYLARMLKHEELMYDNKQMNTFAERFGQAYKYGDEVEDGFNVFGNFGKIRELLVEQTNQRFKAAIKAMSRERGGREITEMERKALWEKELNVVLPRYGFHNADIMDGKTLPMLELTDEQRRLLSPTGLAYKMNTAIGDAANNSRKIKMARDENELLQVYDKFQHFIKLQQTAVMPGFHVKNKYSNLFQSWLGVGRDAVNIKIHSAAQKAVYHKGDLEKLKDMKPLVSDDGTKVFHWHDMYQKAVDWGVIDEGYFAQDLSKMTQSTGLLKGIVPGKFDPTSTADFIPYKMATNVGSHVENGDRLVHFASMLKQGHSIDDAADSVAKHLFDYSDLTVFERQVMKRIFPYYTWIKKNARLQTSAIIEQPEKYLMVAKVHSGIEGMSNEEDRIDRAFLPDFAKDWIKTPFSTTNGQGQKIPMMLSPNMPYMDLARLPDIFNPVDSAREWFGMTSPLMKVPLELAANYNSFFNENIVKHDEEDPEKNTKSPALARLNHVAGQMGWYSAIRNVAKSKGTTQGFHVLNTLAGVKFMNHNEIFARQEMMKGLYEGNSDLGRAMTGFTEEIRTRIGNRVYLMQGAMADLVQDGAVALTGVPPRHAEDYTGALAPISQTTYEELPEEERAKYAPPSKEDVAIYTKEAVRLQEEAYAETGLIKQFVWSLFDETDQVADKEVVRVTKVSDGDTFQADNGSSQFGLRLLMVDTPETVDPDMSGPQPYGKEASDFSKTMLLGKDVSIHVDGKDLYNRTLAYVELDGNDYNKMLIEEGLGKMRYLDGTTDHDRYTDYRKAEKEAADSKTGLWSIDGYARPGVDEGFNGAE